MQFVLSLCLSALTQSPAPVENVSSFPPRSAFEERKALHVPEGFEVQLVAAEPAIQKPMNIAFDDKGRLWVTGTVEYPYPAKDGTKPRDTVKILEDFQPDGRAGKITTFAEGLNIPIGLMPLPDSTGALVYSIPTVDRHSDTDGDGRADRRATLYREYGHQDTHGMTGSFTWGFDGWIYACHGFSNTSKVEGTDDKPIQMASGNVYRMKLDGSRAEYVTHGQVNPFGLTFDPLGNLYSSDCHSRPIYQLLRGAYYPSFGKPDDGLGFGPEMMSHDHGSTAIDGATYYAANQFPPAYRDTIFTGNVLTNRINHDRLEFRGSSPKAIEQPDFLWSEDNWFRPVDIELGPDGALYVADFYNRIIGHYEVPLTHPGRDHDHGRIWRIVYRGPKKENGSVTTRGDWTKATNDELIADLGHPNLVVRTKAANQLSTRKSEDLDSQLTSVVASDSDVWRKVHALWVLQRRGHLDDATLDRAAAEPARELRVHAMRVIAERPSLVDSLSKRAREALTDQDALVQRSAAEALGRHPDFANVRPLLALRQSAPSEDTHLIHVVRMALRDQFLTASAWNALASASLSERDARDLADVAPGIPTAESAKYLISHVERYAEPDGTLVRYLHHIARYGNEDSVRAMLAFLRNRSEPSPAQLASFLKAVLQGTQERGATLSGEGQEMALKLTRRLVDSPKKDELLLGIDLVKSFKLTELRGPLESRVRNAKSEIPLRIEAMTAVVVMAPEKSVTLLGQVLGDSSEPFELRDKAASALALINQAGSTEVLLKVLPTAPERLQATIATGLAARKPGAELLLKTIGEGKASARLLQEPRVALLLGNQEIDRIKERVATLLKDLPPADARLRDLVKQRHDGFGTAPRDVARGAAVFEKNCVACHQIAGKGQRIGPQLDGIGTRGIDRLLEDVLDPNRNVDQAFRVTNVAQRDGQLVSGLLLKEEGEILVFADAQGKEVRVPKETVEERTTSQLSPMPANLSDQITEPEFYDLLAYLLQQKESSSKPANEGGTVKEGSR
ncbi:PVC-type heme-binding CxxCH protein [Singulisphaera sp. Ch08]|uniref:PVC-type heme-binding CxxCH protein n=1 Tax=Singulisphaera sp. Ch08 TaxID=3120278 RepID=A0AAU7CPK4_9BACT